MRLLVAGVLLCVVKAVLAQGEEEEDGDDDTSPWLYVSIPFISGIIGYGTNWLALKMTFHPINFWGIPCYRWKNQPIGIIGWQGIVPAKAAKMAADTCRLMMEKLFDINELFRRLNPEELTKVFEPGMDELMTGLLTEIAEERAPTLWAGLPDTLKQEVFVKAREGSHAFMAGLVKDLGANVEDYFDLQDMVVGTIDADKRILNDLFTRVGKPEFKFIERSGFVFGFFFGLFQMTLFIFFDAWWVLPAFGFVVGYATNYIALYMIFRPLNPHLVCCGRYTLQGVFLKRQMEVSAAFGEVVYEKVLNSELLWDGMLHGAKAAEFHTLLQRHCQLFVDNMMGPLKPVAVMMLGDAGYADMVGDAAGKLSERLPEHTHYLHDYTNHALQITATLRVAMRNLPFDEFEGVLHPVFQEDEIKLILVGAFLGLAVGFFQEFVIFG